MSLPDLGLIDWLMIAAAAWAIFAIAVAPTLGRAMRRGDDARRAVYPPPVPPSTYRYDDWLALAPVDALSDDEVTDRFMDMTGRERWFA